MHSYVLTLLKASEMGAIMAYKKIGSQDKNGVDQTAVEAINFILSHEKFPGQVVIGEGELDGAPLLYPGQTFANNIIFDMAVDPVEGTIPVAFNNPGAITSFAIAQKGTIAKLPEMYMEKLFVAPYLKNIVNLQKGLKWNVEAFKQKTHKNELKTIILNKPRHKKIIEWMKKMGVHVKLINDGDVLGAMDVVNGEADFLYGIGGSPEGALMASLAIASNAKLEWKLKKISELITKKTNDPNRARIEMQEVAKTRFKYDQVYSCYDLVNDKKTLFISTAITAGTTFNAINYQNKVYKVMSMMATNGIVRNMTSTYNMDKILKNDKNFANIFTK